MKKALLILILFALFIAGCKDNTSQDTAPKPNPGPVIVKDADKLIIGKWHYTADTVKKYTNGVLQQTDPTGGVTSASYLQFNADSTGVSSNGAGANAFFSYTITDNIVTIDMPLQTVGGIPVPESIKRGTIKKINDSAMMIFFDTTVLDSNVTTETTEAAYFSR